jgi:phage/plasmid-like protein (TIGR03299 family)
MFMNQIETRNIHEAMEAGGHNFNVVKEDLYTGDGLHIPDHQAVLNENDGSYLGTVGRGYEPVQPATIYEIGEELMESTEGKIIGNFSLRGGSTMGIVFNIAHREYIPGDKTELNFIMTNGFDGWQGVAGHGNINRLACLNQCNPSNRVYSLKHTKNVLNRVEVVKNMLKYYHNEIASFDDKMNYLVGHRMSDAEAVEWFKSLLPAPKTRRAETRVENQAATFIDLLHHGRGSEIVGVRGTSYGAFQALTEFINHERSTRVTAGRDEDEVRFEAVHFGSGNTLTQKGLKTLTSSFTFDASEFLID